MKSNLRRKTLFTLGAAAVGCMSLSTTTLNAPESKVVKDTKSPYYFQNNENSEKVNKVSLNSDSDLEVSEIKDLIEQAEILLSQTSEMIEKEEMKIRKYEAIPLNQDLKKFIVDVSEEYGVDPDVMFAIYYKETRFHTNLDNSQSTARGLGQILAGTAEWCYKQIYGSNAIYNHSYAYDPYLNVRMTTYYIKYLLGISGSYERAIQHYYGGPGKESYAKDVLNYCYSLK